MGMLSITDVARSPIGILLVVLAILCLILLGLSLLADYGLTKLTSSPTPRGRATPQEDARLIVEL